MMFHHLSAATTAKLLLLTTTEAAPIALMTFVFVVVESLGMAVCKGVIREGLQNLLIRGQITCMVVRHVMLRVQLRAECVLDGPKLKLIQR